VSWRISRAVWQAHRVGENLHDALVAGFVTVAERAVDDSVSPVLREAVDVGQLIYGAGRGQDASGNDRVPPDELDAQAACAVAGNAVGSSRDDFTAIAADLLLPCAQQLRGRYPLMAQVAVYVRGGGVARFAGIDDDDRPSLPSQLQRGAQASGGTTDDGHVAMAFEGKNSVITHTKMLPASCVINIYSCSIRKLRRVHE